MAGNWAEEDWSLQLAEAGAADVSMHDLNTGASEGMQKARNEVMKQRRERLLKEVGGRDKQSLSVEEMKEKNRKALEARLKAKDAMLPAGWVRVESRSKPGSYVYENEHTGERQAWFPTEPAIKPVEKEQPKGLSEEQKEKNRKALEAYKKKMEANLPAGWKKVESRSKPGTFVYENEFTEERIAWIPTEPAKKEAMPEQKAEVKKDAVKAKAMYPYVAATAEEIDLLVDDIIIVEFQADNGWWVGTDVRSGQLGMFPGSFVQVVS
eukprot:m.66715 g.66715  ORF g.66715 m.66715 type:complete len:266 (+) comp16580_c2_seq1:85-882(+)